MTALAYRWSIKIINWLVSGIPRYRLFELNIFCLFFKRVFRVIFFVNMQFIKDACISPIQFNRPISNFKYNENCLRRTLCTIRKFSLVPPSYFYNLIHTYTLKLAIKPNFPNAETGWFCRSCGSKNLKNQKHDTHVYNGHILVYYMENKQRKQMLL